MRGGKFFAPGAKNIPARRSRREQGPVSAAAPRSKHRRAALLSRRACLRARPHTLEKTVLSCGRRIGRSAAWTPRGGETAGRPARDRSDAAVHRERRVRRRDE